MVYLFLADGFEEIEALTSVDVLRRAGIDIKTVGVTGEIVTGAHNISVHSDICLDDVDESLIDAVILPGGLLGTQNLDENGRVKELIEFTYNNGKKVCAICAAPSILGKMGILKGKKATCYPGFEKYFEGAQYTASSVEVCENVITSNGMGSSFKFAFEITAALKDRETSDRVKSEIQY